MLLPAYILVKAIRFYSCSKRRLGTNTCQGFQQTAGFWSVFSPCMPHTSEYPCDLLPSHFSSVFSHRPQVTPASPLGRNENSDAQLVTGRTCIRKPAATSIATIVETFFVKQHVNSSVDSAEPQNGDIFSRNIFSAHRLCHVLEQASPLTRALPCCPE